MTPKTSTVTHPITKAECVRPWTLPLFIVCCTDCRFSVVAVSAEAADIAVWDHVAYLHLTADKAAAAAAERCA